MALSALQYAILKLNMRAISSANRYIVANLSESDLLGFWNQLMTDAGSSSPLPAAQDAAVDRTFRALLCANNALLPLSDADWASYFTQLATDAAGAAALPAAQYSALKVQLRALISGYRVSPFNLSEADLLSYLQPRGAASSPLSILLTAPPKLWLDSQLGAGANTWADQSAGAHNATEPTNPGALTTLGTVPCYTFNGSSQQFTVGGLAPNVGNWFWLIARQISYNGIGALCGGTTSASGAVFQNASSPSVAVYNGSVANVNPTAMTVGSWLRVKFLIGNTAASYLQVGAPGNKVTGANGTVFDTDWFLGNKAGGSFGNFAIANVVVCATEPSAGEQTALDNWYAAKTFGGVVGF